MTEVLIAQAVGLAIQHLVPAAAGGVSKVAEDVWGWITAKAPAEETSTLAKVEGAPEKGSSRTRLEGLLQEMLEDNPGLVDELAELLKETPQAGVDQTLDQTGDNNKAAQIAGSGNSVSIS